LPEAGEFRRKICGKNAFFREVRRRGVWGKRCHHGTRALEIMAGIDENVARGGLNMSKTIMTADDSTSVRQMISTTLKGAGYDVIEAKDGKDALGKIQSSRVDMLITDLNMPNMNGIELVKEVRGLSQYRFLPIIMLTTESQDSKKQEGKAAGATGWIVKPFKPDQLITVVKKVLK